MQVELRWSSIQWWFHNLGYQLIYFYSVIFKGLGQMKAVASEERERWFCNTVWWFWDSYFRKTTEDIWSRCSFGRSLSPVGTEHWNQPAAVTGQAAARSEAHHGASFCISALSTLSRTHLVCPASASVWVIIAMCCNEKRLAFIVDGNSTDLEEGHTKALRGPVFQRESLNRRRRNFTDTLSNYKANFSKLPRSVSIGSQKYI